jgi:hypothetical protein
MSQNGGSAADFDAVADEPVQLAANTVGCSPGPAPCYNDFGGGAFPGSARAVTPPYPANRGFIGQPRTETLQPGVRIDRIGGENGLFVSPAGTPVPMRSLPPSSSGKPLNVYEVVKPIDVKAGPTAPYYGQPGLGTQYELPRTVRELIDSGHLRRVP